MAHFFRMSIQDTFISQIREFWRNYLIWESVTRKLSETVPEQTRWQEDIRLSQLSFKKKYMVVIREWYTHHSCMLNGWRPINLSQESLTSSIIVRIVFLLRRKYWEKSYPKTITNTLIYVPWAFLFWKF